MKGASARARRVVAGDPASSPAGVSDPGCRTRARDFANLLESRGTGRWFHVAKRALIRLSVAPPPSPSRPLCTAFAALLLAVSAPVACAQSYSYSYFYETVTFAPTAAPPAPTPALTFAPTFCFDADNGALDGFGGSCEFYY